MSGDHPTTYHTWSARSGRLITVVYVALAFIGFMTLAHFVFHSGEAVKALFIVAVGSVGSVVPTIMTKAEYKLTGRGLMKRPLRPKKPPEYKTVFSWDELSHFIPTSSGFKYYKKMPASGALKRSFGLHFSSRYSGEFQAKTEDRDRVRAIIDQMAIPTSKPPSFRQVRSMSGV